MTSAHNPHVIANVSRRNVPIARTGSLAPLKPLIGLRRWIGVPMHHLPRGAFAAEDLVRSPLDPTTILRY
jgi:hypothetical protein